MASSSSSRAVREDPSRPRRPSNGGPTAASAKPQGRPMPTPRRVVLNSPYSNMPANPMALPEDIRPPAEEEESDSNASTDNFWEQDDDLRQIIEGQLKEKTTDAPVPMPQPATGKDPLKLDFPAAEVDDAPWEEWQTVAETPRDSGHATPFEPIGVPVSSPSFPQPSGAMPEPQRTTQMAMPEPPSRFPSAHLQGAQGYFGTPARRFTDDDDLDSPSQHIPGRYPVYPKHRLPIQEEDDTPPAPSAVSLVSTPSIYPPVQTSVGVQADPFPETGPAPLFPYAQAAASPLVPSIYSESSSLLPDVEVPSAPPIPVWTPPPASSMVSNEPVWSKPTAPLKLGNKPTSVQPPQPMAMPTAQQKPSTPAIPQSLSSASRPTGTTLNATSKPSTQSNHPEISPTNTSSSLSPNKPSQQQQPAKPSHVAAQKPPAPSFAPTPFTRPDKPSNQLEDSNGTALNAGKPPTKPTPSIQPPSSSGDITLTPSHSKPPPIKPVASLKPEATPAKPPAEVAASASSSKPTRPDPEPYPSQMSTASSHTRYVNMLLALDDIPQWFNLLASFFTWVLLAGFLLFPGTFTSLQQAANETMSDVQRRILTAVTHVPLFVLAWVCCGIGAAGMIWLWWRWNANYIWVTSKIFLPGFMNGLAGVISTLVNVFGVQDGQFSTTAKVTIIVVSCTAGICGLLLIFYQLWLLRNVRKEHDRIVGAQAAGKHGEGVLKSLMKSKNSSKNSEKRGV